MLPATLKTATLQAAHRKRDGRRKWLLCEYSQVSLLQKEEPSQIKQKHKMTHYSCKSAKNANSGFVSSVLLSDSRFRETRVQVEVFHQACLPGNFYISMQQLVWTIVDNKFQCAFPFMAQVF